MFRCSRGWCGLSQNQPAYGALPDSQPDLISRDLEAVEGERCGHIQTLYPVPPSQRNKEKVARPKSYFQNIDVLHLRRPGVVQRIEIECAEPLSITGDTSQVNRRNEFDLFVPVNLRHHD